jgi:hypothetical protein
MGGTKGNNKRTNNRKSLLMKNFLKSEPAFSLTQSDYSHQISLSLIEV